MTNHSLHSLLSRQLKKVGLSSNEPPSAGQWREFLERVHRSYADADQDRYTLERSLEISSNEMQELYEDLRRASETLLAKERDRLRAVLEASGDGICAIDPEGKVALINPAGESMLGYAAGGLAGKHFLDLVGVGRSRLQSRPPGMALRDDDAHFIRADGSALPVAYIHSSIIADGREQGAVVVFRDVTKARETSAALSQARDDAIRASNLKSEFLATMSHEIRTPLNGVIGMTRVLLDSEPAEDVHDGLQIIQRCGKHLLHIISDILDFSKIEAGHMSLDAIDFDLSSTIDDSTATIREAVRRKGVDLRVHIDPALPRRMRGDPARVRQVLMNLLSNAEKFTNAGWIELRASLRRRTKDRVVMELSVEDTGSGIPESDLPRLFDAFTQADGSHARKVGGTGLGLSITKQLVTMMEGSIGVTSRLGEGTTFTATLTTLAAERDPPVPRTTPPGATADHPSKTSLPRRVRVLLAEDVEVNQKVAMHMLHRLGCTIELVTNGEAAVAACRKDDFDLILMDCQMPGMDGYAATRAIRELGGRHATIPIIAMTANALDGDRERCLSAGMDDYISKPVSKKTLRETMSRWAGELSDAA